MPLPDPFEPGLTKQFLPGYNEEQKLKIRESVNHCVSNNLELSLWPNELFRIIQILASNGYDREDSETILSTHNLLPSSSGIPQVVWAYVCRMPLIAASRLQVYKESLGSTYLNPLRRIRMMDEQLQIIRDSINDIYETLEKEGDTMNGTEKSTLRGQIGYFQNMALQYFRQISQEQALLENWVGIKQDVLVGDPSMDVNRLGDDVAFSPKVLQDSSGGGVDQHIRMIAAKSSVMEGLRGLRDMPKEALLEKLKEFKEAMGKE